MGGLFSCLVDEDGFDHHERERLNLLQQGTRFTRKTLMALGLSLGSEQVLVRLSDDQSAISWRTIDARGSPGYGDIKVTSVDSVKATGAAGLVLMGKDQSKELELEAEDTSTRDSWVIALSEVVERSKETGRHRAAEKERKTYEEAASKQQYWTSRRRELLDGQKAAAERKSKYANVGMTFTARAMAGGGRTTS